MANDEVSLQWDASATALSYHVYRNGTKIATVDETTFVDHSLEGAEEYCYKVTANCDGYVESDPSNEACITFVGVSENETARFELFPNPVGDCLTIQGDHLEHVVIYDILGQKIREFSTQEHTLTLSTSHFANGVYLISINGHQMKRFVVSHE